MRIAWTLALGPHVLAIPGTGDPAHLEENVAAASLRLTDDDLSGARDPRLSTTPTGPPLRSGADGSKFPSVVTGSVRP